MIPWRYLQEGCELLSIWLLVLDVLDFIAAHAKLGSEKRCFVGAKRGEMVAAIKPQVSASIIAADPSCLGIHPTSLPGKERY